MSRSISENLIRYIAVQSVEIQQMFRRNTSPTSSVSKDKRARQQKTVLSICHDGNFFGLFLDPEGVSDMFLGNDS
jgi:hypothetical protein